MVAEPVATRSFRFQHTPRPGSGNVPVPLPVGRTPYELIGSLDRCPSEHACRLRRQVAWQRSDQAFFAAGACHVLAWVCREAYPDHGIQLVGMRLAGDLQVSHTYATWQGLAFYHSGWNVEKDLLEVNVAFEGRPLEPILLSPRLHEFCRQHHHRLPDQFWQDPIPRARSYLTRHPPPWT